MPYCGGDYAEEAPVMREGTGGNPRFFEPISQNGGNVLSVLTSRGKTQEGTSHVYIRLHAMDSEKEKALIENMKKAMPLEYWMDDEFHCNRNC